MDAGFPFEILLFVLLFGGLWLFNTGVPALILRLLRNSGRS